MAKDAKKPAKSTKKSGPKMSGMMGGKKPKGC